jgi:hypothetical protein
LADDLPHVESFSDCGKWIGTLMRKPGVERERKDFADFYQRTRDDCLRAVLAGTGDRTLAEDLVAEAFARAWASWQKVGRHPAPAAWVVRTALNTRVSWWRRRRREVALDGHDRAQFAEDRPIEAIEQRGRARRRNRGLFGVVAGGGLAAVAALALAVPMVSHHSGTVPAESGPVAGASTAGDTPAAQQAAFTVATQADGSVELTLDPKKILNPDALQKALADAGIPAVVKAGVLCTPKGKELPESKEVFRVKRVTAPDGSTFYDLIITPSKMPQNSVIYFSVFAVNKVSGYAKAAWPLVSKDDPMNCRPIV